MFALTESMSYYLCPHYVDMRKGIYSLFQLVKSDMKRNPLSGEIFLFVGKNRESINILHWENGGFVLYQKKLERGTFETPLQNSKYDGSFMAGILQLRYIYSMPVERIIKLFGE